VSAPNPVTIRARFLTPNTLIIPINNFAKPSIHRLDARVQKRVSFGGRRTLDGMLEVFNVTNHANYASFVTDEANALFGTPTFNSNIAYQPRTLQLGFRFAF
jgi:hypothetical protein